jgi:hypothetical protein
VVPWASSPDDGDRQLAVALDLLFARSVVRPASTGQPSVP